MKNVWKRWKTWVIPVLIALSIFLLFQFVLLVGYVPTESMEPSIHKDSYVIGFRLFTNLTEGDVIIFRHEKQLLVKRIAGIFNEGYLVLGDNTENSYDSRYWTNPYVQKEDIVAKLIFP